MVKVMKNYFFFINFEETTFAVNRLWTFCRRNFCRFGQKRKTTKHSSAKVHAI